MVRSAIRLFGLSVLLACGACGGTLDLTACSILCSTSADCPSGLACGLDGRCHDTAGDCRDGDGGSGADGAPDAACVLSGCTCADPAATCLQEEDPRAGETSAVCVLTGFSCDPLNVCPEGYECAPDNVCMCSDLDLCGMMCGAGDACPCGLACRPALDRCDEPIPECVLTGDCVGSVCETGQCMTGGPGVTGDPCQGDVDCVERRCLMQTCLHRCERNGECGINQICLQSQQTSQRSCVDDSLCPVNCTDPAFFCGAIFTPDDCAMSCRVSGDCPISMECVIVLEDGECATGAHCPDPSLAWVPGKGCTDRTRCAIDADCVGGFACIGSLCVTAL